MGDIQHAHRSLRFGIAASCLSAALVSAALLWPAALGRLLLLLLLSVLAPLAVAKPRVALALALVASICVQTLQHLMPYAGIGVVDDAAVLGSAVVVLIRCQRTLGLRPFPGLRWLGLFASSGLVSAAIHEVPVAVTVSGCWIALKGVLFGWAVAQLTITSRDIQLLARWASLGMAVLAAGAVANLLAPARWSSLFAFGGVPEYRGPLPSVVSFFPHPSFFGQMCALFGIAALAWAQHISSRAKWLALFGGLLSILAFRRKTHLALPMAVVIAFGRRRPAAVLAASALLLPPVLLLGWGSISSVAEETYVQYYQAAERTPRNVLYNGALDIAQRDFPLGSGFGRFGSVIAIEQYSPEYTSRGFASVYGLEPTGSGGQFGADTFWPAIVGESGVLGAVGYTILLGAIWRLFARARGHGRDRWEQCLGVIGVGWTVLLLIESVAAPVFFGPPTFPMLFGLAGLLVALQAGANACEPRR